MLYQKKYVFLSPLQFQLRPWRELVGWRDLLKREREDRQEMMVVKSISSKYRYISELVLVFGLGKVSKKN